MNLIKLNKNVKPMSIRPLDLINIKDILGCFFYVLSKDIIITIDRIKRNYSVSSYIKDIGKDTVTLKVEDDVYFKPNEKVRVSFIINSIRYGFDAIVKLAKKEGQILLTIPSVIYHDDQRGLPRVNLPETINNCLELVTGFFSGVRIKGKVEDISLGGLGFSPNNIESVRRSNEVDIKSAKIKAGDRFRNLKFEIDEDVLNIPVEICHTPDDERNTFGIKFDLSRNTKNCDKLKEFIRSFVPQKSVINFASFYEKRKRDN